MLSANWKSHSGIALSPQVKEAMLKSSQETHKKRKDKIDFIAEGLYMWMTTSSKGWTLEDTDIRNYYRGLAGVAHDAYRGVIMDRDEREQWLRDLNLEY